MGTGARGQKNQNGMVTRPKTKFDEILSCLDAIHECDRQTDGRTDTGRQQRPRLRIVLRSNNTDKIQSKEKVIYGHLYLYVLKQLSSRNFKRITVL